LLQKDIEKYYKSEDRVRAFRIKEQEKLARIGIKTRKPSKNYMYLECSVCGKKDFKERKNETK